MIRRTFLRSLSCFLPFGRRTPEKLVLGDVEVGVWESVVDWRTSHLYRSLCSDSVRVRVGMLRIDAPYNFASGKFELPRPGVRDDVAAIGLFVAEQIDSVRYAGFRSHGMLDGKVWFWPGRHIDYTSDGGPHEVDVRLEVFPVPAVTLSDFHRYVMK